MKLIYLLHEIHYTYTMKPITYCMQPVIYLNHYAHYL